MIMDQRGEIVLYQPDEKTRIEARLDEDTVWLTQQQMGELFQTTRNNVTLHIGNIFKEGELQERAVCKESLRTASDGKQHINRQVVALQQHIDDRLLKIENRLDRQEEEIDFCIRTNQKPKEFVIHTGINPDYILSCVG